MDPNKVTPAEACGYRTLIDRLREMYPDREPAVRTATSLDDTFSEAQLRAAMRQAESTPEAQAGWAKVVAAIGEEKARLVRKATEDLAVQAAVALRALNTPAKSPPPPGGRSWADYQRAMAERGFQVPDEGETTVFAGYSIWQLYKDDPKPAAAPLVADESLAINFAASEINRLWRVPSPPPKAPAKRWLGYLLGGFALLAVLAYAAQYQGLPPW